MALVSVTYVGPFDEVVFFQRGIERTAVNGEPVEVPADVADGLLEQPDNWQPTAKPSKTAPAKPGKED